MIQNTTVYICDKCKDVITEDSKAYNFQEIQVPKKFIEVNTSLCSVTSNTFTSIWGAPKTYHICNNCCEKIKYFMEPSA